MTSPKISSAKRTSFTKRRATAGCLSALAGTLLMSTAYADAPKVVATIKPIHSIAAAIMEGVGEPTILIDGAASPHGFALKPSQAHVLQEADAVFWVGPELAPSLAKPISSMATNAAVVELLDAPGISHLELREGANFDAHDHGDHEGHAGHDHDDHGDHDDHAEHDDHDHDDHDHDKHADHDDHDHDHDDHAEKHSGEAHADHDHEEGHDHDHEKEHAHDDHDDHDHEHAHHHGDERDAHIWLNPDNGIAIAGAIAHTLSEIDPEHADIYAANAKKFGEKIEALETGIEAEVAPLKDKKFIVFHDAYHHFEHHFGLEASGAITVSPEALSSADRIAEIQHRIQDLNVTCVFQEPQFDAKLVTVALEGSNAKSGTLDPLGAELTAGPDLYPALLSNLAKSLSDCLGNGS